MGAWRAASGAAASGSRSSSGLLAVRLVGVLVVVLGLAGRGLRVGVRRRYVERPRDPAGHRHPGGRVAGGGSVAAPVQLASWRADGSGAAASVRLCVAACRAAAGRPGSANGSAVDGPARSGRSTSDRATAGRSTSGRARSGRSSRSRAAVGDRGPRAHCRGRRRRRPRWSTRPATSRAGPAPARPDRRAVRAPRRHARPAAARRRTRVRRRHGRAARVLGHRRGAVRRSAAAGRAHPPAGRGGARSDALAGAAVARLATGAGSATGASAATGRGSTTSAAAAIRSAPSARCPSNGALRSRHRGLRRREVDRLPAAFPRCQPVHFGSARHRDRLGRSAGRVRHRIRVDVASVPARPKWTGQRRHFLDGSRSTSTIRLDAGRRRLGLGRAEHRRRSRPGSGSGGTRAGAAPGGPRSLGSRAVAGGDAGADDGTAGGVGAASGGRGCGRAAAAWRLPAPLSSSAGSAAAGVNRSSAPAYASTGTAAAASSPVGASRVRWWPSGCSAGGGDQLVPSAARKSACGTTPRGRRGSTVVGELTSAHSPCGRTGSGARSGAGPKQRPARDPVAHWVDDGAA